MSTGWDQNGDTRSSIGLPYNLDLFPVTAVTVVLALGITAGQMLFAKNVSALALWHSLPSEVVVREPWRLLTHVLPHANFMHIAFNVMFMVRFGRQVEGRFGALPTLGIFALTGVTAGAAQYAFSQGGIGLSGVVYGLFGFLWVMDQLDDGALRGTMHRSTINWMIGWIVVGSLLSLGGAPIGNTAHIAGAVFGGLLGKVVGTDPRRRMPFLAALVIATVWVVACALWGREFVNVPHLMGWHPLPRGG